MVYRASVCFQRSIKHKVNCAEYLGKAVVRLNALFFETSQHILRLVLVIEAVIAVLY